MPLLQFRQTDGLEIVDRDGKIVQLNDRNRTILRFTLAERERALKLLDRLNRTASPAKRPFQLVPVYLPVLNEPSEWVKEE